MTPQNLSEWRLGGYREWLARRDATALSRQIGQQAVTGDAGVGPGQEKGLTEKVAQWVVGRYVVASRYVKAAEGPTQWKLLREMCQDIVALRRGDQRAQRLAGLGARPSRPAEPPANPPSIPDENDRLAEAILAAATLESNQIRPDRTEYSAPRARTAAPACPRSGNSWSAIRPVPGFLPKSPPAEEFAA